MIALAQVVPIALWVMAMDQVDPRLMRKFSRMGRDGIMRCPSSRTVDESAAEMDRVDGTNFLGMSREEKIRLLCE